MAFTEQEEAAIRFAVALWRDLPSRSMARVADLVARNHAVPVRRVAVLVWEAHDRLKAEAA